MTASAPTRLHREHSASSLAGTVRCAHTAAFRAPTLGATALLVAGVLGLGSCGKPKMDRSPVGVAKRFVAAVKSRDTAAVYALLGPRTRARLAQAAAQVPVPKGAKPRAPHEMLFPAWRANAAPDWQPKRFVLISRTTKVALVEVRGEKPKQRAVLHLVRAAGAWRVEFERPPLPQAATTTSASQPGAAQRAGDAGGSAARGRKRSDAPQGPIRLSARRTPGGRAAPRPNTARSVPRGSSRPPTQ